MGNQRLYDIMKEKDALYAKEDFTDADGVKASELEAEFADMDGWEAESDVSRLIQGLGLSEDILYSEMSTLTAKEKVKVLLAQALFGKPDIILLDEPTNHLDIHAVEWLEDFILECESLIIVVSHDRHFLNTVCTNIVDVSGNSANVVEAVELAKSMGVFCVGMTAEGGGKMKTLCDECIAVPVKVTARAQEMHILIGHILCELVDGE